ncbi:TetR/AcrR family transcriptional regulator [Chryseobacterium bernardetii]|uniref:TetR/AcrR family transcriptional regulator n=1 Tax=Chryseobacterium bernardetii TaxID=1241978 RepID=A0A3G6TL31_9FLAO|nr:TetR/AcrR family transcriptional regulator [Chryseobacterium bernardetii]AZB27004.1 TetR/AcrR family transcriptional regulator [Chryseobacterium bernardetii]
MKKAELTRLNILQKAYELIYTKGYQATSIDEIIATTKVTKGAFYYHFKNKDEMGIAVVNEVLSATTGYHFQLSAIIDRDPVETIYQMMHELLIENKFMKVEYGCPVSNLVQEMAPWHDNFREALKKEAAEWEKRLVTILENGKKNGFIRQDVNSVQATFFILSGYWGIRNFGKLQNDQFVYMYYLNELKIFLGNLR